MRNMFFSRYITCEFRHFYFHPSLMDCCHFSQSVLATRTNDVTEATCGIWHPGRYKFTKRRVSYLTPFDVSAHIKWCERSYQMVWALTPYGVRSFWKGLDGTCKRRKVVINGCVNKWRLKKNWYIFVSYLWSNEVVWTFMKFKICLYF